MHPVESDSYVIATLALQDFVNVCLSWIRGNIGGALVPGLQRIGKSCAVDYFVTNFREWMGDSVGVVSVEIASHRTTSEGVFFYDLLKSMKRPTTKKSPEDRRNLFLGRLVEIGGRSRLKKIAIIIDEAQELDYFLFKLLVSVHNDMERLFKIKCVWILVGQPELAAFPTVYIASGKRQILGRFMADIFTFLPLTDITDFAAALKCFDEKLFFPADGPSYTAHFAPGPSAAGWTLASEAGVLWQGVVDARTKMGLPQNSGMTMKGFTQLVNRLMIYALPSLAVGDHLTAKQVEQAIDDTNCMIFEAQEALLSTANSSPMSG